MLVFLKSFWETCVCVGGGGGVLSGKNKGCSKPYPKQEGVFSHSEGFPTCGMLKHSPHQLSKQMGIYCAQMLH